MMHFASAACVGLTLSGCGSGGLRGDIDDSALVDGSEEDRQLGKKKVLVDGCKDKTIKKCEKKGKGCKDGDCFDILVDGCKPKQVKKCEKKGEGFTCKDKKCIEPLVDGCTAKQVKKCAKKDGYYCLDGKCEEELEDGCTAKQLKKCAKKGNGCTDGKCVTPPTPVPVPAPVPVPTPVPVPVPTPVPVPVPVPAPVPVPTPVPTPPVGPEVPTCQGCGGHWGNDECWPTCGHKAGACGNCIGTQGTPGACCKKGHGGDPDDCKSVPASAFKHTAFHECVLLKDLIEVPKCTGCGGWHGNDECHPVCNGAGMCSACEGTQGSNGACCRKGWGSDPSECKTVPLENFKHHSFHECVLLADGVLPEEVPKCTGCGGFHGNDECWPACGGRGNCGACQGTQGTAGACCKKGDGGDPAECKSVPASAFKHSHFHECVLLKDLVEVPMCTGCGGWHGPSECWPACGARGSCNACQGSMGSPGACCKRGDGADPSECTSAPLENFKHSGFHECILTR